MVAVIYKSYSQTAVNSVTDETFRRVSNIVYEIYFTLLLSAIMATVGAVLSIVFPLGTTITCLNFIFTVSWFYCIERRDQLHMFLTFLASSLFFGATTTSLMHSFFSVAERDIIIFFGGVALLFCFHIFALRTHNIQVIYHINHFNLPLFILSLVVSLYFISHGVFPDDLYHVILFVIVVPFLWHLGLWCFCDKIWPCGFWVRIHLYLLNLLSSFSNYHVFYLMGVYLFMLCILENLKLHTFDSINLAARPDEHASLPVSLSLTFFTEFLGRFTYMFIYSGQTLYENLWQTNHIVLEHIWQTCCTFCAKVFDFYLLFLWKSFMNIFSKVWDSICASSSRFKDYVVRVMMAFIGLALFIIFTFFFVAAILYVRGMSTAN